MFYPATYVRVAAHNNNKKKNTSIGLLLSFNLAPSFTDTR
jgi:hypothetical protein